MVSQTKTSRYRKPPGKSTNVLQRDKQDSHTVAKTSSQKLLEILERSSGKGALSTSGKFTGKACDKNVTQTTVQNHEHTSELKTEPSEKLNEEPLGKASKITDDTPDSHPEASPKAAEAVDQIVDETATLALGLQKVSCEDSTGGNLDQTQKATENDNPVKRFDESSWSFSKIPQSVSAQPHGISASDNIDQKPSNLAKADSKGKGKKQVTFASQTNCGKSVSLAPSNDLNKLGDSIAKPDQPWGDIHPIPQTDWSSWPVTLTPYHWSEPELTRLWEMCRHDEEIGDIGVPTQERGCLAAEGTQNWCEQCRKCTNRNEEESNRKRLRNHGERTFANAAVAKIHFKRNQRPRSRPGVVGHVKEHIFDTWDPSIRIETTYWTRENVARFNRDEERKFHERRTDWGCWGHKGHLVGTVNRKWDCCQRGEELAGCFVYERHKYINENILRTAWQLYETPQGTPADFRHAVVMNCQMGRNEWGQNELIKITALDYFSGEILIDKMVWPSVPLWHTDRWSTGIDMAQLEKAHKEKSTIEGRDAARELLWRFVGEKTILIVHAGRRDFLSLRLTHSHVLDVQRVPNDNPVFDLYTMAEMHMQHPAQPDSIRSTLEGAQTCRELTRYFSLKDDVAFV